MYSATLWPPLKFPPPVSETGNGGTFGQPTFPPLRYPSAVTNSQQWTPTPPPVNNLAIENYSVTQQQIAAYFNIQGTNPFPSG